MRRGDGVGAVGGGFVGDRRKVGHRVIAGLELRLITHLGALVVVAAVDRARHAHPTAVDGNDRVGAQHVGTGMGQPDRQLSRRRQVGAGGEDQGPGVAWRLAGAGAHHADTDGPGSAVDRIQVVVEGRALQPGAGAP